MSTVGVATLPHQSPSIHSTAPTWVRPFESLPPRVKKYKAPSPVSTPTNSPSDYKPQAKK